VTDQITAKRPELISFLNNFEKLLWEHQHAEEPEIAVSTRHAELLFQSLELIPDIKNTLSNEDWES